MRPKVIDMTPLLRASSVGDRLRVAQQLHQACVETGVFYVTGHGIDTVAFVERMRDFFTLPQAQKLAVAVSPGGFARGYIGMGDESGSDALEVKEAFSYGYPWDPGRPRDNDMQAPNVWPDPSVLPGGWRAAMEDAYAALCRVAEGLARGFSLANAHEEDWLPGFCRGGETISLMRLFHYFPYERASERFPQRQDRIGSSPHTDWGFLTLIIQQGDVSGLQVMHEGKWHDVEPLPGALVVNCGDYFSLLTGGRYVSPLHRVVAADHERLSGVFFYYPAHDARIPWIGNAAHSLLQDQRLQGGRMDRGRVTESSFGDFIAEKWRQVQRPRS